MQFQDNLGVSHTASGADSTAQYSALLDSYLGARSDTMVLLDQLLETDENMPMAHCMRGYILKMGGDPRLSKVALACLTKFASMEDQLNEREHLHLQAFRHWLNNQYAKTTASLEQILAKFPRDIFALRVAHYLHFYAGEAIDMRDSILRAATHWQANDPFYGYVLGMKSFGYEESGDYQLAEQAGRAAVDINNKDIWAAHAVAHVMQMQGRSIEGIPWLGNLLGNWADANNFIFHLHWHKALFHIGQQDLDGALSIYDNHLAAALKDDFYLDVCNATALLWRLQMHGMDVGDRWEALREFSKNRVEDDELIFSSIHYLMAPVVLQDQETVDLALNHFNYWAEQDTDQGKICKQVGLPLAQSIVDIGHGDYGTATKRLAGIQSNIVKIGGSHAQRHLFDELLDFYQQQAS